MQATTSSPLAATGLQSYRYKGRLGWIMIGAKDVADALGEASRSTNERLQPERLEAWHSCSRMYLPAIKPAYETCNDQTGWFAKVLPLAPYFKAVIYDADGDVRDGLSLWCDDLDSAITYAKQIEVNEQTQNELVSQANG